MDDAKRKSKGEAGPGSEGGLSGTAGDPYCPIQVQAGIGATVSGADEVEMGDGSDDEMIDFAVKAITGLDGFTLTRGGRRMRFCLGQSPLVT